MAIESVREAIKNLPYDISKVDLIIGGSYTPYDTVGTIAHRIQKEFNIENAKSVYISSACSSFINALEIAEDYFALGKAEFALVVVSEHNSKYSNEDDEKSGYLWGDGAATIFVSKTKSSHNLACIKDIYTKGLGHIGKSIDAVYCHPTNGGIRMPFGKDVFVHACNYMTEALENITKKNGLKILDPDYIIPHQANIRIIDHIAQSLKIPEGKMLANIGELGNTGCASTLIAFSRNIEKMTPGTKVGFTVFGAGYSCGSLLIQF